MASELKITKFDFPIETRIEYQAKFDKIIKKQQYIYIFSDPFRKYIHKKFNLTQEDVNDLIQSFSDKFQIQEKTPLSLDNFIQLLGYIRLMQNGYKGEEIYDYEGNFEEIPALSDKKQMKDPFEQSILTLSGALEEYGFQQDLNPPKLNKQSSSRINLYPSLGKISESHEKNENDILQLENNLNEDGNQFNQNKEHQINQFEEALPSSDCIRIVGYENRNSYYLKQYQVYQIRYRNQQVSRRYSEFVLLSNYFKSNTNFMGNITPTLPETRLLNTVSFDKDFVEQRKKQLEYYLEQCIGSVKIKEDPVFIQFITNIEPFDQILKQLRENQLNKGSINASIVIPNPDDQNLSNKIKQIFGRIQSVSLVSLKEFFEQILTRNPEIREEFKTNFNNCINQKNLLIQKQDGIHQLIKQVERDLTIDQFADIQNFQQQQQIDNKELNQGFMKTQQIYQKYMQKQKDYNQQFLEKLRKYFYKTRDGLNSFNYVEEMLMKFGKSQISSLELNQKINSEKHDQKLISAIGVLYNELIKLNEELTMDMDKTIQSYLTKCSLAANQND